MAKYYFLNLLILLATTSSFAQDYLRSNERIQTSDGMVTIVETRMPWKSKFIPKIVSGSLPLYSPPDEVILIPNSPFGSQEYAESLFHLRHIDERFRAELVDIDVEYPPTQLMASDMPYDQRYLLVELAIKEYIEQFVSVMKPGETLRIGIASFYHPIYYPNEKALAFHTMAAIDLALRDVRPDTPLEIVIFCNNNPRVEAAFHDEYNYRKSIGRQITQKIHTSKLKFVHVTFDVAQSPDAKAEVAYYLRWLDLQLKNNNLHELMPDGNLKTLTASDVVKKFLTNGPVNCAPEHVVKAIRAMVKTVYKNGSPSQSIIQNAVKGLALKEYENHPEQKKMADQKTSEIMLEFKNENIGSFEKISICSVLLQKNASIRRLQEALDRVTRR